MKLALYGAFDRMNYGDLMFPLVLDELYREILGPGVSTELYSPTSVPENTAAQWGLPFAVNAFSSFLSGDGSGSTVLLVVAGGEVLGAEWLTAVQTIQPKISFIPRCLRRMGQTSAANRYIAWRHGQKRQGPYLINHSDLPFGVHVIYQTSGGSAISLKNARVKEDVKSSLAGAFDVSLRDHETGRQVSELLGEVSDIRIAPDSVIEISRLFPVEDLRRRSGSGVRDLVDRLNAEGGYLSFQCSEPFSSGRECEIAAELHRMYKSQDRPVVLVSIGRAFKHMDQVALEKIKNLCSFQVHLPDNTTIFEIAYLIACSAAFIGTSLHGAVTSMSYGIPHVAINRKSRKLTCFLESWDLSEQKDCVDVEAMTEKVQQVLRIPKAELVGSADRLKALSRESFVALEAKINSLA